MTTPTQPERVTKVTIYNKNGKRKLAPRYYYGSTRFMQFVKSHLYWYCNPVTAKYDVDKGDYAVVQYGMIMFDDCDTFTVADVKPHKE